MPYENKEVLVTQVSAVAASLQTRERIALVRVWDAMFRGAREFVEEAGFIGVHNAPEIVGITGACENVDTLFKVDYFGKQAYLAQSDQLYLELLTPVLGKVYAEIQSFRMEPEADDRHLTQFSLFELEHQGDLDELIENIEGVVRGAVDNVIFLDTEIHDTLGMSPEWIEFLRTLTFARITYTEAIDALVEKFPKLSWGDDLKADHEAELCAMFGPVFVTHYPMPIKFFNMRENEDDPRVVNSCDLLLPFSGESAGAAERETDYDTIVHRLKTSDMYARLIELGGKDEDFDWYLNAHKGKDIPPHSGCGIGMARVAQFIIGQPDIRESVPFLMNKDNLL